MLLTPHVLKDLLGTMALMALLAVAYGSLLRAMRQAEAQLVLGVLFGGAAVIAMLDPIQVAEGVIIDLRNVPVVLAGAYLGPPGAAAATLMATGMRAWAGGIGMLGGIVGIVVACLVGLAWASRRRSGRGLRSVAMLAGVSSCYLLSGFLVPADVAWRMVTSVWPFLVPLHVLGVLVVGALLERERQIATERSQLGLDAALDPLTGLLNRRGFEAAIAGLPFAPHGSSLLVLDLDRFKHVNDTHGHAAGDAVLHSLSARLREASQSSDVVARFGGEEIVVLLHDVEQHHCEAAAARLCEVVRAQPFVLPGGERISVTASVGAAWTSGQATTPVLLTRADRALYAAKQAGRDCWRLEIVTGLDGVFLDGPRASPREAAAA